MTAQSWREDAVGVRAALFWGIFVEFSACSSLEGLSFQLESLQRDLWPFSSILPLASALCLGETAFSLRRASGVFFGGGPFASWFLGFVRSSEYRQSTDFQLIPVRGSSPIVPVHCSNSILRQISPAAGTQSL